MSHSANSSGPRRRGYTLTDICVVIAAGLMLIALTLPLARRSGSSSVRIKCASNLRQIAMAAIMYGGQETRNNGKFPRTYYDPQQPLQLYTGKDTRNAFVMPAPAAGPLPNDVTASFYHLLKSSDLTAEVLVCPESDAKPITGVDIQSKSNFSGPEVLSYSYNTPFAKPNAISSGWRFDTTLSPDYPLAADINPGDSTTGGPTKVSYTASRTQMEPANSPNHWYDGQNVAYVDAHVEWQTTPFCGAPKASRPWRDNIYASAAGVNATTGQGGVIKDFAQDPTDSILLPTAEDTIAGQSLKLPPRVPGQGPSVLNSMGSLEPVQLVALAIGLGLLATAIVMVVKAARKKPVAASAYATPVDPHQPM